MAYIQVLRVLSIRSPENCDFSSTALISVLVAVRCLIDVRELKSIPI
jgi:hypothetical protein